MSIENPSQPEKGSPQEVKKALEELIIAINGEKKGKEIIAYAADHKGESLPLARRPKKIEKNEPQKGVKEKRPMDWDKFKKMNKEDARRRALAYEDKDEDDF